MCNSVRLLAGGLRVGVKEDEGGEGQRDCGKQQVLRGSKRAVQGSGGIKEKPGDDTIDRVWGAGGVTKGGAD